MTKISETDIHTASGPFTGNPQVAPPTASPWRPLGGRDRLLGRFEVKP